MPGSLKARLCREGKAELEAFCTAHAIPVEHVGKLVVAVDDTELDGLASLRERGIANGVPDLQVLGPDGIREREPHVEGSASTLESDNSDRRLPTGRLFPGG